MGIISRRWRWLKRFRHRRGYGVHSPFAFQFITYVIYERGTYYAYADLRKKHGCAAYLWNGHEVRCRKLLFRLANFVHPKQLLLCGRLTEAHLDYLKAGCRSAETKQVAPEESIHDTKNLQHDRPSTTLLVIGNGIPPETWPSLADSLPEGRSMCLITGIHAGTAARTAWEATKQLPSVVVSFDLYDYGLLFYDSSKQRQHYIVNF